MNKIIASIIMAGALLPAPALAATSVTKTLTGTVTKIQGSVITFRTSAAAYYAADSSVAALTRRNGSPMQLHEILAGDKVQVTGRVWPENTITASGIRNMSLYAHTGTFTGKITNINSYGSSFTMESGAYGTQTVRTTVFTSFKKNNSAAGFKDLQLGMTAKVKGVWERSRANLEAANVEASFRLINISFTGRLSVMNGTALTVIDSGGGFYAVDAQGAKVLSKNGKTLKLAELRLGDELKIKGKHISGMPGVAAGEIKDISLNK